MKTFNEFINESGDYYENLYKNGKLTITYTYKQLGLDKIVEKFHKETGIPKQFIIDEFFHEYDPTMLYFNSHKYNTNILYQSIYHTK